MLQRASFCLFVVIVVVGCSDESGPCDPNADTGCDDGQVCEVVSGGEPACFGPVVITGRVFDLSDDTAGFIQGVKR